MQGVSAKKRAIQSLVCGMLIGFICGFVGAGGGMMMLLILTSVLGYELKTAVGTSVFIMAFTALTGSFPFCHWGHARLDRMDPVRHLYPDLGPDCRTVRQQGHTQDSEPCHRCDSRDPGSGSNGLQPVNLSDFLYLVYSPAERSLHCSADFL